MITHYAFSGLNLMFIGAKADVLQGGGRGQSS